MWLVTPTHKHTDTADRLQTRTDTSVGRYNGTIAAPWYHFSTLPVPLPLQYFLVLQYTTRIEVLWHGTCPLLTHSNEDCIIFRLKLQPSACLLSFTAKLYMFYIFYVVLFYSVYQMSEMTSIRRWLAFSVNYL